MNGFIPYAFQMKKNLECILASDALHAKWLNTLSFLENCGARKIAACEHPTLVKEEMLKHAAEEFRHAYYLKRQIGKISPHPIKTYSLSSILGGTATLHYLAALNLKACRYLKSQNLSINAIKEAAYLLVTYAIERRAEELYPLYETALREMGSRVVVKSILLEEKEHLNEMKEGLNKISSGFKHAEEICKIESDLCQKWLEAVQSEISSCDIRL